MTACVQTLPSLVIPSSPRIPKFYLKKPTSNIQETKEDFRVTVKHFQKKFPTLSSLYSSNNSNARQMTDNSNLWSYGTPYLVKLLFSGNLSKAFFDEICKACETTERKRQKKQPTEDGEEPKQIWLPKNKVKLRESGRRTEQRILEARLRHKDYLENVSIRAEKLRNKTEVIRLKKAGEMGRGKTIALERMQKEQIRPSRLIQRQVRSPLIIQSIKHKVFELTEPLPTC